MKYEYRKAPNPTEFSVFTGLGETALDHKTIAKDVPCQNACPAKTNVPGYIEKIAEGNYDAAYRINLEDNVFPSALGRICTRPCESACRHNWTGVEGPVTICHLKRSSADLLKEYPQPFKPWFTPTANKIAIIGGGPAGLTAARELVRYGHKVTIFEREDHLGGMMFDGIPKFRLPREEVQREIDLIIHSGVEVKLKSNIDAAKFDELRKTYDAVLVAAGTMKPRPLGLRGADEKQLISGLQFMKDYNEGRITSLEGDVVVIGGGFTAVDCARSCARAAKRLVGSDNTVSIMYRRTEHHMAAEFEELEEIRMEQIDIRTLVSPVSLNTENGKIKSVTFSRNMILDEEDGSGKSGFVPLANSEFTVKADHVIVAIGQEQEWDLLPAGLKINEGGSKEKTSQRTNDKKVFACGDYLIGGKDVITAVAEGKAVADEIDRFLTGQVRKKIHISVELINRSGETSGRVRAHDVQRPAKMPLLSLVERAVDDAEVELGYRDQQAHVNATRCYLCNYKFEINQDKCIHCNWCIQVAPRDCIKRVSRVFFDTDGAPTDYVEAAHAHEGTFIYMDSNECIRCGKCLRVCPTEAITMRKMERTACLTHS